jgi:hypothetical protein
MATIGPMTQAAAEAYPAPKHCVASGHDWYVQTGDDVPFASDVGQSDAFEIKRLLPTPGQQALRFRPQYSIAASSADYANTFSTGGQRVIQEDGVPFLYVRYTGAFGEVLWQLLQEDGATVVSQQYMYPASSPTYFQPWFVSPFAGDDVEKELIIYFKNLAIANAGPAPKQRVIFNNSVGYRVGSFKVLEIKYGYANARHLYFEDSASPFGYKSYSIREGATTGLWFLEADGMKTFFDRIDFAISLGCSAVRFSTHYKAAINEDGSVNHPILEKFQRALSYCNAKGLQVTISLNHGFNSGGYAEYVVYPDQITTPEARSALKERCAKFLGLVAGNKAITAVEIQNESNLYFTSDTRNTPSDFAAAWDYFSKIGQAIRENTDFPVLFSTSNGGSNINWFAAANTLGADIVDIHIYGMLLSEFSPYNVTLISHETGSVSELKKAQYSSEMVGAWWQFLTPGQALYDVDYHAAFKAARPGQNNVTIAPASSVYADDKNALSQVGSDVSTVWRYNPTSKHQSIAWVRVDGSWVAQYAEGATASDSTAAGFTASVGNTPRRTILTGSIATDQTISLSNTSAYQGATFKFTRKGAGAGNWIIGSGLKTLVQNTWATVEYDGTAWVLTEAGTL